jgi:orotate phosphoribosyltransferase
VREEIASRLPAREGHFLLESGLHTNTWLALDALFVHPPEIEPVVEALAERLRRYELTAICGPMVGGALLAQALASRLGVSFYYTELRETRSASGLFGARYELAPALRSSVRGQRVGVVDDAISAGSSVRATVDALDAAGACTVAVATLLLLGARASEHFAARGVPVEALEERALDLWEPPDCPLCRDGVPLSDPRVSQPPRTVEAETRELVERFYAEVWNAHDASKVRDLLREDVTFRGSLGRTLSGRDAFASYVDDVHRSLGDYRCDILDLVVEADRAFARMRFSGVSRGELLGCPPTGARVEWTGAALFTFRDRKIVDLWVLGDVHGLLERLARGSV